MSDTVIQVENLSKKYFIGHQKQEQYMVLRDVVARNVKSVFQTLNPFIQRSRPKSQPVEEFWALNDVSFDVKQGDRIGIIGHNGAGKSTLLKILSRITAPTAGSIRLKGRVASLLEVGTGFHAELSGRENIYLNGAILGMSKAEIRRKFDEIVAFAEVEQFLDTPVKRYSSGMYVRLAFAVAAHLEPEILIVDEVLAVGDAAFQKKCLGKMENVADQGRTILFVSHNMQAVQSLCKRVIQLEAGQVIRQGLPQTIVAQYLCSISAVSSEMKWAENFAPGNHEIRLTALRAYSSDRMTWGTYSSRDDLYIELEFIAHKNPSALCIGFDLVTPDGTVVFRSYQTDLQAEKAPVLELGENVWRCIIPAGLLNAGMYYVCPRIGIHNLYWIVNLDAVIQFEIILDHGVSLLWNSLSNKQRPGLIAPILNWQKKSI